MTTLLDRVNTTKRKSTINLSKKGESYSINLDKSNNELSFNLNWGATS